VNVVFLGGADFDSPPPLGTTDRTRYSKVTTLEEVQRPELHKVDRGGGPHAGLDLRAYTVRNATVGGIRDARMAGSRPATAPIRMAEAMPPVHAWAGMTTAQLFELA